MTVFLAHFFHQVAEHFHGLPRHSCPRHLSRLHYFFFLIAVARWHANMAQQQCRLASCMTASLIPWTAMHRGDGSFLHWDYVGMTGPASLLASQREKSPRPRKTAAVLIAPLTYPLLMFTYPLVALKPTLTSCSFHQESRPDLQLHGKRIETSDETQWSDL